MGPGLVLTSGFSSKRNKRGEKVDQEFCTHKRTWSRIERRKDKVVKGMSHVSNGPEVDNKDASTEDSVCRGTKITYGGIPTGWW